MLTKAGWWGWLGAALLFVGGLAQEQPAPAAPSASAAPPSEGAPRNRAKLEERLRKADAFFQGPIVRLEFEFKREEWENLQREHRRYAECVMTETLADGERKVYRHVGVKLKGALGSFQGPEERPGLTVSLNQFKGADRFHGMDKFHLNNGAQDVSLLNEFLGGAWCRAAGVPASRCTHVIVKWQGRELGAYLFKEAATREFLSAFFAQTHGNLYDGHVVNEIDGELERQNGEGEEDHADRMALAAACRESDEPRRWEAVAARLDVEAFLRVVALENFTCHWDGYCFNRNNYRLYFDPASGRGYFICHGMDQLFNELDWPVGRVPEGLVGQAVWSNPAWRQRYREVAGGIYTNALKATDWDALLASQGQKVQEALARRDPDGAREYSHHVEKARQRVAARLESIRWQFGEPPEVLAWENNALQLGPKRWRAQGGGVADQGELDGRLCFRLRAEGDDYASWRRRLELEGGRYRLEGRIKVAGVRGGGDENGKGAGLRISGSSRAGGNGVQGTTRWRDVVFEFETPGGEVVLVADLRAPRGEAWFEIGSLRLVRVP